MRHPLSLLVVTLVLLAGLSQIGRTKKTEADPGITAAAEAFVQSLSPEQKKVTLYAADSPEQVGWHFIPKDERKGLEMNSMSAEQQKLVLQLVKSLLSKQGFHKTTEIMALEKLLKELQVRDGGSSPIRDPLRYYATIFGSPSDSSRWGLSFEGHHLSLNYVIENGRVVSSTPQFFATNPATVKTANNVGIQLGTRLLRFEETVAFELVQTLSKEQRKSAILAEKAPREIRGAGDAQPPTEAAVGVSWRDLSMKQRQLLRRLIKEYVDAVPREVAAERNAAIKEAGYRNIKFAWAGATVPDVGHYYRVQGPTFLIEFVNTQPDADGNPANHIHCVWRDMRGDFGKKL